MPRRQRALTRRQVEVLSFIRDSRIPPTYREISDALKIKSTNQVAELVVALSNRGYLDRGKPYEARQMTVTTAGKAALTRRLREIEARDDGRDEGRDEETDTPSTP